MKAGLVLLLPAFSLLAACSSHQSPATPDDTAMRRDARAADLAFSLDRPLEAIRKYQAALIKAHARDDTEAIGDYGYNLTVAQLAAHQTGQALATARETRTELARRGRASFAALDLAEAIACYRIGEKQQSDLIATHVEGDIDPIAAARASFLRGLIADEANDEPGLDQAIGRLADGQSAAQRADAAELGARRDMRRSALAAATTEAELAVELRRSILDYRGMARALSVAADAELRAGRSEAAAVLFLRAGESAAAQGDAEAARPPLRRALDVSHDPVLRQAALRTMNELRTSAD
jgi:hypothetical protein